MAKTLITQITECIERIFDRGAELAEKIIIYPCGDVGIQAVNIMERIYQIKPAYLIDNNKCKYSKKIQDISILNSINAEEYVLFLTSTNPDIYKELKSRVLEHFPEERVIELEEMLNLNNFKWEWECTTEIGKYSYGPICKNHSMIKSIGAFCSFALGVDCVGNHEMNYVTLHPMLYHGKHIEGFDWPFELFSETDYYFPGVEPKSEKIKKQKRITIGNDVWLGKNVIITNSANIGNGVIAAAGAVITKDVPDYAVVAGVPARIIRYRYTPEQIEALNKIAWWDWSDDEIRERYDDFYLPIEEFIEKYKG